MNKLRICRVDFLKPNIVALKNLLAVDSDDELLDLYVDVRLQKAQELEDSEEERRQIAFDLDSISNTGVERFRMAKEDIPVLTTKLRLPDDMESGRVSWSGAEGLCVVLARLSAPNRRFDLVDLFGRGMAQLSVILNCTLDFLFLTWNHLFSDLYFHRNSWFSDVKLQEGCHVIAQKCPMRNVFGFIDGTTHRICRPKVHQRTWCSGRKSRHVMKFQSVMLPCGTCVHLFGPFEDRRHDSAMLNSSNLLEQTSRNIPHVNASPSFLLYGDKGYPLEAALLTPFGGNNLTPGEVAFNTSMSYARIAVASGFAAVTSQCSLLSAWKRMRIGLNPVGQYHVVATLLFNCIACLYENEVSLFFNVKPPTLDQYLQ